MTTSTSSRSARATTPKDAGPRVTDPSSGSTSPPSGRTSRNSGLKAAGSTVWYLTDHKGNLVTVKVPTGNSRASWSKGPTGNGGQVRIYQTPGTTVYDFATDNIATIHSDRVIVETHGKAPAFLVALAADEAAASKSKKEREKILEERVLNLVLDKHMSEMDAREVANLEMEEEPEAIETAEDIEIRLF